MRMWQNVPASVGQRQSHCGDCMQCMQSPCVYTKWQHCGEQQSLDHVDSGLLRTNALEFYIQQLTLTRPLHIQNWETNHSWPLHRDREWAVKSSAWITQSSLGTGLPGHCRTLPVTTAQLSFCSLSLRLCHTNYSGDKTFETFEMSPWWGQQCLYSMGAGAFVCQILPTKLPSQSLSSLLTLSSMSQ